MEAYLHQQGSIASVRLPWTGFDGWQRGTAFAPLGLRPIPRIHQVSGLLSTSFAPPPYDEGIPQWHRHSKQQEEGRFLCPLLVA
eukprot:c39821_g1_i1 orf=2-250(-)